MLDAPLTSRAAKPGSSRRSAGAPSLRRDLAEDFARTAPQSREQLQDQDREHYVPRRRFSGLRFRLKGGVPRSSAGKAAATAILLLGLAAITAALWQMRSALLHNPRLVIASSEDIQITGNRHLTRPQLLSVFGEDVDRNILTVPLAARRAQLEQLPWVEHATVMRLLPNRFRVAITERTPVAFVRQGSSIGLVDASGVLLDMAPDGEHTEETHYSFPVLSGVSRADSLSARAARMHLYRKFEAELDASGEAVSHGLSEVDLSNPEDIKALIPAGRSDVLVHFGDRDFLHRYQLFQKNLAGWQATYPHLASADMRYERQVVLEMARGSEVPVPAEEKAAVAKAAGGPAGKTPAHRPPNEPQKTPVAKAAPHSAPATPAAVKTTSAVPTPAGGHLQTAFDVPAKGKARAPRVDPQ